MSANERIQLVDHWNRPIGACERHVMRKHRLLHRATYVLVIDSQQRLCVQLRSQSKDYCPGYWDIAAGGVLAENECYHDGAARELFEELGIDSPIQFISEFYTQGDDGGRAFGQLFVTHWNEAVCAQAEEIDAIEWLSVTEIEQRAAQMTPDSLLAMKLYQHQPQAQQWQVGDCVRFGTQVSTQFEIVEQLILANDQISYVVCDSAKRNEIISQTTLNAWFWKSGMLLPIAENIKQTC